MMKKIVLCFVFIVISLQSVYAHVDKNSREYLKGHHHVAVMNPVAESFVEKAIKTALKKETGAKFDVKFSGYTLSSMKKGIFKYLEITGKNIVVEEIPLSYVNVKTLSDYNYIDYTKEPVIFKSDMTFQYDVEVTDEAVNAVLKTDEYKKILSNVNKLAYPIFRVDSVATKIAKNRMYIMVEYNSPIVPSPKNKLFAVSSDFQVVDGNVKAVDIKFDKTYNHIALYKVANLINLLNPLEYTLKILDSKGCNAKIENVKIVDDKVQINGRIFVEGESQ